MAWQLAGIFFLTWLSEDAAVLGAAVAAASGALPVTASFLACFGGLWSGDFLLFLIARHGGRPLAERFLGSGAGWIVRMERSEAWFRKRGIVALIVSRFVPGLRLTTFLAAGFLRMSSPVFAIVTGVMSLVWPAVVFLLVRLLGKAAPGAFHELQGHLYLIMGGSFVALGLIHLLPGFLKKIPHWEFWPAWIFYLPVAVRYMTLAARYGSLTLPSGANPCMKTGGLIGESKFETLARLREIAPECVPPTAWIPEGGERTKALDAFLECHDLSYPVVLKPDLGCRGSGFRIIRSREEAEAYLETVPLPVIAQSYLAGPGEAGLFYCRMPGEQRGRILAITEKCFPELTGDGTRTISELILADPRAKRQAGTLLKRFRDRSNLIPPAGETIRLVEAGNHAQGCLFRDGMHLLGPRLEERIDRIARELDGFFLGRFDVRYAKEDDLREGRSFGIIELNGAAGEPTSAYDATKGLVAAYAKLFRQWELAFRIGSLNRKLGHPPDSVSSILKEWANYRKMSRCHPVAD